MSRIRSKNTSPELKIRKALWADGIRYRIHDKTVLGTPDISIKTKKIAVFIDGCFWHGCPSCYIKPKSNKLYWRKKLSYNKNRRKIVKDKLKADGWKIMEFWECNIRNKPERIVSKIKTKIKKEND